MIDECFVYIRLISGAQFKAVGKLNQIQVEDNFNLNIPKSIAKYG